MARKKRASKKKATEKKVRGRKARARRTGNSARPMSALRVANQIDRRLSKIQEDNPLSEENAAEYLKFCAATRSTLEVLESRARGLVIGA